MIIGGSKLKIELQEVFETGLAYRVLEQTLPRQCGYANSFIRALSYPEIKQDSLFIRGEISSGDFDMSLFDFKSHKARDNYIAKVKQTLEEINKTESLTFERIKRECVPMKHLLVENLGDKRLYLGFTRTGVLITDSSTGHCSFEWDESEICDWTIEPYEVSDEK